MVTKGYYSWDPVQAKQNDPPFKNISRGTDNCSVEIWCESNEKTGILLNLQNYGVATFQDNIFLHRNEKVSIN